MTDADPPIPSDGWRPAPFREFILKVASRCNLSCDYCYMYGADQSWRRQPRLMPDRVVEQVGRRVAAHVTRHAVDKITVMLHGGEPLLAGASRLVEIAGAVRERVPASTRVRVSTQTNGVLLDEDGLRTLAAGGIRLAVSLDGDEAAHDKHRRDRAGGGSHAAVSRAVRMLADPAHRPAFAGVLCVVDLANDPVEVYRALAAATPPVVDFLLPFGNWSSPPPGRPPDETTPYGDWLVRAFDAWYESPAGRPEVRLFREVITLLLGGRSHTEQVGLSPACMVVFTADGMIEQVDSLRSAHAGAAATGMSVFTHDLEEALAHPAVRARQLGLEALAPECRGCPLVRVCGGGHYTHRYSHDTGFRNRSVYCADLARLIRHIRDRVERDVAVLRKTT